MMVGSPELQHTSPEAGMHLICFSIPLSIGSGALLHCTAKLLLAADTDSCRFPLKSVQAPFGAGTEKAGLRTTYAGNLWIPWK